MGVKHAIILTNRYKNYEPISLDNNVKKYVTKNSQIYVWLPEARDSESADPIILDCSGIKKPFSVETCSTFYVHSSGLGYSYEFLREQVDEKDYFKKVKEMNIFLENKIQNLRKN